MSGKFSFRLLWITVLLSLALLWGCGGSSSSSPSTSGSTDFTLAVGKYNGTLSSKVSTPDYTVEMTVDSTGKVSGSNSTGDITISGNLTSSSTSTELNFSGTTLSKTGSTTMVATLDTKTKIFTGTTSINNATYSLNASKFNGVVASYDSAYANCVYFPGENRYWIQAYIVDPSKNVKSATLTGYNITNPVTYTYNLYPNLPGRWAINQNVLVETPPPFPLNYTVHVVNMDGTTQSIDLVVTKFQNAQ